MRVVSRNPVHRQPNTSTDSDDYVTFLADIKNLCLKIRWLKDTVLGLYSNTLRQSHEPGKILYSHQENRTNYLGIIILIGQVSTCLVTRVLQTYTDGTLPNQPSATKRPTTEQEQFS